MDDYRLTPDGVQARQLTKKELELMQLAQARLPQIRVPRLLDSPHDRVFVAAMDGTGNDRTDPLERRTIVARLSDDLDRLRNPAIAVGYVPGIGTQDRFLPRAIDGMSAATFEARVEHAYLQFCTQAARWLEEEPDARIHLAGIGFSRGAEAVAALQRMVHERGIRDPMGATPVYGSDGILQRITWADQPPLVPPGRTAQVAVLIDPVATGLHDHDRRLPGSNVGALQFTSVLEPRDHFPGTMLLPLGLSDQGRVANLLIPGSHSDTGGSYLLDGAGRVVYNASVDYFNALFGEELLQHVPVALDPRMFVAHRSDQHLFGLWPTSEWQREGERRTHTGLGPGCEPVAAEVCLRDPIDYRIAGGLEYHYLERGRSPGGSDAKMDLARAAIDRMYERFPTLLDRAMAASPAPGPAQVLKARDGLQGMFEQLVEASSERNDLAFKAVTRAWMATPMGQVFKPGFAAAQAWMSREQEHGREQAAQAAILLPEQPPSVRHQPHAPAMQP